MAYKYIQNEEDIEKQIKFLLFNDGHDLAAFIAFGNKSPELLNDIYNQTNDPNVKHKIKNEFIP